MFLNTQRSYKRDQNSYVNKYLKDKKRYKRIYNISFSKIKSLVIVNCIISAIFIGYLKINAMVEYKKERYVQLVKKYIKIKKSNISLKYKYHIYDVSDINNIEKINNVSNHDKVVNDKIYQYKNF